MSRGYIDWTDKMDKYIMKNYHVIKFEEMSEHLGVTYNALKSRCKKLIKPLHRQNKTWSEFEIELLDKYVGLKNLTELANMLKRTVNAVILKLYDIEGTCDLVVLKGFMRSTDIATIMGVDVSTVHNWVNLNKIKAIKVRSYFHYDEEYFWNWLESNLDKVNLKKIEPYILMTSPDWYAKYIKEEQRKLYQDEVRLKRYTPFTSKEKAYISNEKVKGRCLRDIAKEINRSYNSVRIQSGRLNKIKESKVG